MPKQYRVSCEMVVDAHSHEDAAKTAFKKIMKWEDYLPLAVVTAMPTPDDPQPLPKNIDISEVLIYGVRIN